jgi:hypothetical protein
LKQKIKDMQATEQQVFRFLDWLKLSKVTNMYAAVPYLIKRFPDMEWGFAEEMLLAWFENRKIVN